MYRFVGFKEDLSVEASIAACVDKGGVLATIHGPEELLEFQNALTEVGATYANLGLNERETAGKLVWYDSTPYDFKLSPFYEPWLVPSTDA